MDGRSLNVGDRNPSRRPEVRLKISLANKGKKRTDAMKKHLSIVKTGIKASLETRKKLSLIHKGKPKNAEWNRKNSEAQRGEKNHNWKGGLTPEQQKIRNSREYAIWRTAVFTRDNFTCIWCFVRGGKLNADHIKSFAQFPELRFAIDNGRTLCVPCHKTTDNYAGKSKRK